MKGVFFMWYKWNHLIFSNEEFDYSALETEHIERITINMRISKNEVQTHRNKCGTDWLGCSRIQNLQEIKGNLVVSQTKELWFDHTQIQSSSSNQPRSTWKDLLQGYIFWAVLLELKCIFLLPHNWISLDNIEKSLVDLKTFKVYLFPGSEVIISSNFESLQIINNINFFQVWLMSDLWFLLLKAN